MPLYGGIQSYSVRNNRLAALVPDIAIGKRYGMEAGPGALR